MILWNTHGQILWFHHVYVLIFCFVLAQFFFAAIPINSSLLIMALKQNRNYCSIKSKRNYFQTWTDSYFVGSIFLSSFFSSLTINRANYFFSPSSFNLPFFQHVSFDIKSLENRYGKFWTPLKQIKHYFSPKFNLTFQGFRAVKSFLLHLDSLGRSNNLAAG